MISWIQRSFQHHFKIIFGVVLAGTIVSFIVTIGATPGIGRADRSAVKRDFFGHNLASATDMQQVMRDGQISAELQGGAPDDDRLRSYALQRVAALAMADQLNLPPATATEMEGYIRNLPVFMGRDGKFDPARYAEVRSEPQQLLGASGDEIARVLSDDVRIDRVQHLVDGPGYVLPGDVRNEIVRSDTSWTLGVATVAYASYHPAIVPTDAQLAKYYDQNAFRYGVPPQVEAGYVGFSALNYLSEVKVTDADVRAHYDEDPAKFDALAPKPAVAPKVQPTADAKFAAVRLRVETDLRLNRARQLAAKAASDFAYDLYENKVAAGAPFDAFLASRHLVLKPLAPFSEQSGPAEFGGSAALGQAAFQLNADRYYSEAEPIPDGAAVLIWRNTIPARKPALAEVRARVLADYVEAERRQSFIALGRTLKSQLEARIKSGEKFASAVAQVAAQAGVKIDAKVLPPFTLNARPENVDDSILSTLDHLKQGSVSDMVATADNGYLVYAQEQKLPDPKKEAARAAEIRGELALYGSRGQSILYFSDAVSRELKRTEDAARAE